MVKRELPDAACVHQVGNIRRVRMIVLNVMEYLLQSRSGCRFFQHFDNFLNIFDIMLTLTMGEQRNELKPHFLVKEVGFLYYG